MRFLNPVTAMVNQLTANTHLGLVVVASVGFDNDWAAYQGLSGWDPERVAKEGVKLPRDTAEKLFPVCVRAGLKYRL